jgi:hypothetical protein
MVIGVGVALLVGFLCVVPLLAEPPGDASDPEEEAWLSGEWRKYQEFWGDVAVKARWETIPWLRMTPDKKHALWDEALRHALVEENWRGKPSREIPFDCPDSEYTPDVSGFEFRRPDRSQTAELLEEQGQVTGVRVSGPWGKKQLTWVTVWVSQTVALSQARRADRERACHRSISFNCERSWGDWACRPESESGTACDERAYDDRRWRELEGLTLTREEKHALWNDVLEKTVDLLENRTGPVTLSSDNLDPTYVPDVDGRSFRIRSPAEIADLRKKSPGAEYVTISSYKWIRGPVRVMLSGRVNTEGQVQIRPIAGTPWSSRTTTGGDSWVSVLCTKSTDGWTCEKGTAWTRRSLR